MLGRRFASIALMIASIATTAIGPAEAGFPPPAGWKPTNGLNFGASLAWIGGKETKDAFGPGLEVTYIHRIRMPLFVWVSPGLRLRALHDDVGAIPYLEAGLSFLVFAAGAGYGPGLGGDSMPAHAVNAFAGITIPVWTPAKGRLFYIEPYYRPTWDVAPEGVPVSHEVGVMLKWFFMLTGTTADD